MRTAVANTVNDSFTLHIMNHLQYLAVVTDTLYTNIKYTIVYNIS